MCRWIGYTGDSILLEELLLDDENSLIKQSLESREGAETTNGDGFGVGWYDEHADPGLYKSVRPAWNDRNLRELCQHIRSPMFIAHIRATTGSAVQQTNCHPFRHSQWIMVHNGLIHGFERVKRDLAMAVDPALYPKMQGSTDSELMFFLALTFGLESRPFEALEEMAGLVERAGAERGIEKPLQMTLGLSDGRRLYAVRYSSEGASRSLYHSEDITALKELYPQAAKFSNTARAIVSEPLSDLPGAWVRIPEATALVVEDGKMEMQKFAPRLPA